MKLSEGYDGLNEKSIRELSHEELIQAVLRLFSVESTYEFKDWFGGGYNPDELADAFRGRQ